MSSAKLYTTNYYNTFIEISADSPVAIGETPPEKVDKNTVANIQFNLISKNPYKFTSDEVLFEVFATKNDLTSNELVAAKIQFFAKGQACLRASPLTKRYGWGIHYNAEGKIAIFGAETKEYQEIALNPNVTILKAMKSSK